MHCMQGHPANSIFPFYQLSMAEFVLGHTRGIMSNIAPSEKQARLQHYQELMVMAISYQWSGPSTAQCCRTSRKAVIGNGLTRFQLLRTKCYALCTYSIFVTQPETHNRSAISGISTSMAVRGVNVASFDTSAGNASNLASRNTIKANRAGENHLTHSSLLKLETTRPNNNSCARYHRYQPHS